MNRTLVLGATELKLLIRNKTALTNAVLLPLLIGAFLVYRGTELTGGSELGWALMVSVQTVMVLVLTIYMTATSALTARRQDLYLKRLRSGEVSDGTILSGVLLSTVVLGVLQAAVLFAAAMVAGAPVPQRPDLVLLGVFGGIALCVSFAALTSGLTATAELTQITTMPFMLGVLGTALWVLITPQAEVNELMLATPGGGIASVLRQGFTGDATLDVLLPAVGLMVAWVVVGGTLAGRLFRWEPRR